MSNLLPPEVVTLVVKHRIKAGYAKPYETWLRNIIQVAARQPGHLGVDVVHGKSDGLDTFTCVLRFCSTEVMENWLQSAERIRLVEEAAPMLADGDHTEVNPVNEFWFKPPDEASPPPPRWKQAVVTLCVILPLTLLVPIVWGPVFALNALLANYVVSTFLVTVTIVVLVVYLLMPLATRLFRPWLEASPPRPTDMPETII